MAVPLQKTKLFIPPARSGLVERPRLLERLDGLRAEGCRAALVSAPAGSGKTTLVAQWLHRLGWPVGWLSLDARDNQPARFFAYLIAALRAALPGAGTDIGAEALALLDLPGVSMEEVVTLLANDLEEMPPPALIPFVLVLDDFHLITNPLLHSALDLLIEAQPPRMRLVLLSREDPAMPLARRRARGQLVELRQEDLRFTLDEAVAFLNQSMDLRLTTGQAETLEARTEGWIAGLQMVALSLQRAPDVERFLNNFSGSHRFILDYLMEEVLANQPAEVVRFLLESSILERMCAELCAAVIRDPVIRDSLSIPESTNHESRMTISYQSLLDHINRSNLFIVPLDEERRWYRYHHLFRDLLLARLQAEDPARAAVLERRASDWYEANGDPRLAVEYALKAQDMPRAADLIDRHISERWQTVDLEFHFLINRLPFDVIAERPALCLQSAWLCVILGQTERILSFVEAAEHCVDRPGRSPEPGDETTRAFARTLRAYLADLANQPVRLDESLGLAYAAIPEANPGMRNSVAVVIGTIYYMEGDFASAMRYFEDALALDKRVNGTNAVPIATMRIAFVLQAQGRLREAARRLSESEAYARQRGIRRFYISGALNLRMADILLEWNRLDEAEAQIQEGLRLLEDWPIPAARGMGLSLLARLCIARGDLAGARSALERADVFKRQAGLHPAFLDAIERARVQLLIAAADQAALEAWSRENAPGQQEEAELAFRYEARRIDLCRVWLALGRYDSAAGLLERLAAACQDRDGSRIAILTLLASAYSHQPASIPAALEKLEEALRLGEGEGYLRVFVEAGPPLRRVLETWLQSPRASGNPRLREYAMQVLSAAGPETDRETGPREPAPIFSQAGLPEALSEREREVLRLAAGGLTNQQIADRLVISIRTVKKHIENIHGKLGVQNRTQAAARARELGMLE